MTSRSKILQVAHNNKASELPSVSTVYRRYKPICLAFILLHQSISSLCVRRVLLFHNEEFLHPFSACCFRSAALRKRSVYWYNCNHSRQHSSSGESLDSKLYNSNQDLWKHFEVGYFLGDKHELFVLQLFPL